MHYSRRRRPDRNMIQSANSSCFRYFTRLLPLTGLPAATSAVVGAGEQLAILWKVIVPAAAAVAALAAGGYLVFPPSRPSENIERKLTANSSQKPVNSAPLSPDC